MIGYMPNVYHYMRQENCAIGVACVRLMHSVDLTRRERLAVRILLERQCINLSSTRPTREQFAKMSDLYSLFIRLCERTIKQYNANKGN